MIHIYNILIHFTSFILRIIAFFNPKLKLFVEGRKSVFNQLQNKINSNDKTIWIHCASLGEFEQGLPIIEQLKQVYPNHKTIVSFFSPSGYEVKKNSSVADVITYLPLDTKKNAKQFLKLVHPDMAIFVKYEFWPNYLTQLKKENIRTLLVSGIFRQNQTFFKWHGKWMLKFLNSFEHFFVQNETSKLLLQKINKTNVSVNGDTRFDRVSEIVKRDNSLPFIEVFIDKKTTIVYGSSWPDDETIYLNHLNNSPNTIKHIIAPHNINNSHIEKLKNSISKPVVLHSEMHNKNLAEYSVFIIDTIGILTKIYSYASIAYVGGGFKTGLHNTLEPAVFGIPIIIGPEYDKFQEAIDLVHLKGMLPVSSENEYNQIISSLVTNKTIRELTGKKNKIYIAKKKGATDTVINYIRKTR